MTEQEELELLKQKSPYALPDDPSQSGWSTDQIKRKHYEGLFFLYDLFKQQRTTIANDVAEMQAIIDTINEEYEGIISGRSNKAKYDDDDNEIKTTYAKILNITNGTIGALKYIKANNTTAFIYTIEDNLNALKTAFNNLKSWTDELKNENSNETVLRTVQATKDSLGNVIKDTYATVTSVTLLNTALTNVINGNTIISKTYNDQNGDRIDTTYLKIANIVNVLNDTSTNKALSAAKGKDLQDQINAINLLLTSSDTDLDTIQEIVTYIKNNKTLIENITSDKMSYSALVHNLTTNNDNLPLSASMGYVLKGYIDTLNDAETGIQANEAQRILNENQRISNEEARQTGYSGFDTRITANTNAISGIKDGTTIDSFSDVEGALANVYTKTEVDNKDTAVLNASKSYTDKKIEDLKWELGTYDLGVDTINGTTMLLPSPANTIQATMVRIDGASEISENLIVLNDVAQTTLPSGIVYKVENGTITINGTNTSENTVALTIGFEQNIVMNGSYAFKCFNNTTISKIIHLINNAGGSYNHSLNMDSSQNPSTTFTDTGNGLLFRIVLYIASNEVCNYVIKPMLVKGTVAPTEFKQGFEGIHNLELSGLKVEGANKANIPNKAETTVNGMKYKVDNCVITLNGTSTADSLNLILNNYTLPNGTYTISYEDDNTYSHLAFYKNGTLINGNVNKNNTTTFTIETGDYISIALYIKTNVTCNNKKYIPMIVYGSIAPTTFVPYITPTTISIDLTSIEDSGGNKLFADGSIKGVGTAKDYITPYKAIKKMGIVDLGSLNYGTGYGTNLFNVSLSGVKGLTTNLLSAIYTPTDNWTTFTNNDLMAHISSGGVLILHNNSYTTAEAFKTAMSGVYLVYELATPIEADIDLSQLVKFEAHSNGSITLVNTNNQDTTSTFKYLKEVAK